MVLLDVSTDTERTARRVKASGRVKVETYNLMLTHPAAQYFVNAIQMFSWTFRIGG